MDTSKTQSIRSLLVQAWRERWTDINWGIGIKRVLPRGVSGDVYDLADCILQQALVGPSPNPLFMSYLMHCLSSRVVSCGAVLSSIGRYQSFNKPFCILSLLDLLKKLLSRIGCHGNEEECIVLCKAVVSVTHWLYACVCYSMNKLSESKHSSEHISMMEKSFEVLVHFCNSTFIKSLLFVGKFEDQNMHSQVMLKNKELEEKIGQMPSVSNVTKEVIETALNLVNSVNNLPVPLKLTSKSAKTFQMVGSTVNVMVVIDAILSPANDITVFVNQLLLIKKLENYPLFLLYCEIIRSCFIGIVDVCGHAEDDLKWYAFTFLKLPILIRHIHNAQTNKKDNAFLKALELLLHYTPLLDQVDLRSNCDSLQYLINEFIKIKMLTEPEGIKLIAKRQAETSKLPDQKQAAPKPSSERSQASVTLILRAEHTLKSIIVSFDSDYLKNQEPLLRFLCQILPTKNVKLILAAFSATGKLNTFITKLIEYNDYNKFVHDETVKASQTRALMFDVTFLLLFYVTQCYGIDVVLRNSEKKNTFFVQWIKECFSEGGKFKCPDLALSGCDQETSDDLLLQFLNATEEIKTHQVDWHKVCKNAPIAAKEILVAWIHGAISTEKVKIILDHIKGQFCFLPITISAWLCSYINILHHEERLKPINMLHQFMAPLSETAESANEHQTSQVSSDPDKAFFCERTSLMIGIINKMMFDLHPPKQANDKMAPLVRHGLTVEKPLGKILDEVFHEVHVRGWFDSKSIRYFDTLLWVAGARWLCGSLVRKVFSYSISKDIDRAVDLILGIFHFDIEQFTLALLLHVLPHYLKSEYNQKYLAEPYCTALSRMAAISTFAALQSRACSVGSGMTVGCKRSQDDFDIDEACDISRPSKIQRRNVELFEDTPFNLQSINEEHLHNAVTNPINKAIAELMQTLLVIASDATLRTRSYFPVRFLHQVVLCAKDEASSILQFMPLRLVALLLKKFPEEFSHELILGVSSMQSSRARKVTALNLCHLTIAQNRLTPCYQIGYNF